MSEQQSHAPEQTTPGNILGGAGATCKVLEDSSPIAIYYISSRSLLHNCCFYCQITIHLMNCLFVVTACDHGLFSARCFSFSVI